jgi:hypothetical protein
MSAPMEGRILYSALRALPVPDEPLARLFHAATLLREHRGDGHNIALVAEGIDGQEAHVFAALWMGMKPRDYGRISSPPTSSRWPHGSPRQTIES